MPSLSTLEAALLRELDRYHLRAQLRRFGAAFLVAVLLPLSTGSAGWEWKTLTPIVVGALWVAARETWPTVPWSTVQATIRAHADKMAAGNASPSLTSGPATAPPYVPPPDGKA